MPGFYGGTARLFENAGRGPSGWIGRPGAPPLPLLSPDLPAAGSRAEPTLRRPHDSVRPPASRGIMVAYWRQAGLRWARASGRWGSSGRPGSEVTRARGGRRRARPRWRHSGAWGRPGAAGSGRSLVGAARASTCAPTWAAAPPLARRPRRQRLWRRPLPFAPRSAVKGQVTPPLGAGGRAQVSGRDHRPPSLDVPPSITPGPSTAVHTFHVQLSPSLSPAESPAHRCGGAWTLPHGARSRTWHLCRGKTPPRVLGPCPTRALWLSPSLRSTSPQGTHLTCPGGPAEVCRIGRRVVPGMGAVY